MNYKASPQSATKKTQGKTTDQFIQEARRVHGDRYKYSESIYVNAFAKVKIICSKHGVFEQEAKSHLRGAGCPYCAGRKRHSTEEFIEKASQVHLFKYSYPECVYVNGRTKVKVNCPDHGCFEQAPGHHLMGVGCPVCGDRRSNTNAFVQRAKQVHGDFYDYSWCDYVNKSTNVKIVCPSHGCFEQMPNNHLQGRGCPSCAKTGFDPTKPGLIYFLKFEKPFASFWKVGITNRTARKRFAGDFAFVTSEHSWLLDSGSDAYQIEQLVLKEFEKYRFADTFLFSLLEVGGDTECFVPTMPHKKAIAFIESKVKSVQGAIAA